MKKTVFIFLIVILFWANITVAAGEDLPIGLQKMIESNNERANMTLQNVSFLIAFVAGILTILSPCILPLLPAFFAYTFKEQRKITSMTFVFFLGFTLMFIIFGIIAAFLGEASFAFVQGNMDIFIIAAGAVLIALGYLTISEKWFSGLNTNGKFKNDISGVFIYGLVFALGWTVCIGPILAGILVMAAVLHNFFTAIYLMFFYSLGMFVPLFILSFFYDKFDLSKSKFIKGKELSFGRHKVHSTKLIAGILLIATGVVFIIFQGTGFVNGLSYFGLKNYFYILQRVLVDYKHLVNVIGIIALLLIVWGIWHFIKKNKFK